MMGRSVSNGGVKTRLCDSVFWRRCDDCNEYTGCIFSLGILNSNANCFG
jgi:hypothetical protein